jgi:four helix bundle protein
MSLPPLLSSVVIRTVAQQLNQLLTTALLHCCSIDSYHIIGYSQPMSKYKNLIVWQKANDLAIKVYRLTETFPKKETFGITSQLRRASLSVPTNIVEGYGRRSKKELSHFIDIARGSLAETEYLLEFSKELGYINTDTIIIDNLITEVGKLLWNFQKSL